MDVTLQALLPHCDAAGIRKHAKALLHQQVWCWGRDIVRPEGNWLLEIGFDRIESPSDREGCSSVYSLELPQGRRVVLRGFGVFYGDDRLGGVFLPRFEFRPRYSPRATLECPPWTDADLPKLNPPSDSQRDGCMSLTLDLMDWMRSYEATIVESLGVEYRHSTLAKWKYGKGRSVPAEEMAGTWRMLGIALASYLQVLVT